MSSVCDFGIFGSTTGDCGGDETVEGTDRSDPERISAGSGAEILDADDDPDDGAGE